MSYYLRTLEGLNLGALNTSEFENLLNFYWSQFANVADETERFYKVINALNVKFSDDEIKEYFGSRSDLRDTARRAFDLWEINKSRARQKEQAAQAASEQERARVRAIEQERAEMEREQIDAQRRAAIEQAQQIINEKTEGEKMDELAYLNFQQKVVNTDNVNLPAQQITGGHEYTIVDETENTISYTDETGKLYIEPKAAPVWPWILAAIAGFVLLG